MLPLLALASTPLTIGAVLLVFGAGIGAMDCVMNMQAVVVEDACAGKDRRLHEASLSCLAYAFAYTPKTHELLI